MRVGHALESPADAVYGMRVGHALESPADAVYGMRVGHALESPVEAVAGMHVGHANVHKPLEMFHKLLTTAISSDSGTASYGLSKTSQHRGARYHL
jgi:hypothetical protein